MGKGGAAPTNALQSDENSRLMKENGVLKLKVAELNKVVTQLTAEKEAQKETLRERHLAAVDDWRSKYTTLEAFHQQAMKGNQERERLQRKEIDSLTASLDEANKLNEDLTAKLSSAEDDLAHVRALAAQAVKHQFDMLSGMFKVYRTKSLQMGFHHWEKVKEYGDLQREMDTLRLELRIHKMGGGVRLLSQIFKRWMHLALWSGWASMKTKFMEEYAQYKMMSQLNHMNGVLKQEALRKLHAILNVWAGKACAVQIYNMISAFQYDKRIARISLQADMKLKKTRKWKWFGVWVQYYNDAKERKHWEQFESMKKEIKELKDQLALKDDELEKLMEKYLGARHSAFFDKIDRVIKAWRFGTFGLLFSDWVQTTKNAIREREQAGGRATREQLLSDLRELELEVEKLKKQNEALRAESEEKSKAVTLRDNEIAMLKEKARSLEARTTTLYDQGFADGNKDKDEAVSKLMEKFLLTAQGAFLDKVNEILKAWQFGSFGYMFSSWKSYVNAQKEKDNSLEGRLQKAEEDLAAAKKRIDELERELEAEKKAREKNIADAKKLDMERLETIDRLEDDLAKAQAAAKAARELMESEVEQMEKRLKDKIKELTDDVEEAQEKQRDAEAAESTVRTEKGEVMKQLATAQAEFKAYEEEAEDREKKMNRELQECKTHRKKTEDKLQQLNDAGDDMEKLRKQMQVTISELSEDNERIRLSLKTTKANFEKSREECEDLRAQLAGAPSPQGA